MSDQTHEDSAVIAPIRAALKDPSKPFGMLVQFRTKVGAQARWEAAFAKAAIPTRKEPGVLDYILYRSGSDAATYVLYERWRSLADFEAHVRMPYITTLFGETQALAASAVEVRVLVPVEG